MGMKKDLTVEIVNGEVLVLDTERSVVHRLNGDAGWYVRQLMHDPDMALPDNEVTASLSSSGIIEGPGLSRRRLVAGAASLAAIGIVTLALPTAAAAASGGGGAMGGGGSGETLVDPTGWSRLVDGGGGIQNRQIYIVWEDTNGDPVQFTYSIGGAVNPNMGGTITQYGYVAVTTPADWWTSGDAIATLTGLQSNDNVNYRGLVRTLKYTYPTDLGVEIPPVVVQ